MNLWGQLQTREWITGCFAELYFLNFTSMRCFIFGHLRSNLRTSLALKQSIHSHFQLCTMQFVNHKAKHTICYYFCSLQSLHHYNFVIVYPHKIISPSTTWYPFFNLVFFLIILLVAWWRFLPASPPSVHFLALRAVMQNKVSFVYS